MRRTIVVLILATALTGCGRTRQPEPMGSPTGVLTQKEIASVPVDNAYDAVRRLRPTFLRARASGNKTVSYPVVFVDGVRRGSLDVLQSIRADAVIAIRYLSALDATTRYGLNIDGGVIEVTTIAH